MGPTTQHRSYRIAALVLTLATLAVVFATFRDYGITWDEHYHNDYGRYLLRYYLSGFTDHTALTYHNLWLYGGGFDLPAAIAKRILPFGDFETQHLMCAIAGLIGVYGCYKIGETLGGARAGLFAAVLLLIMPAWYGHMFMNPKDIPFAAGMTWTLYFLIRAAPFFPHVPFPIVAKLGLALGLTLGIRIAGIFALVYVGGTLLVWWAWHLRQVGILPAWKNGWRAMFRIVLPMAGIAYVVMLIAWPWAQWNPVYRPFKALTIFSHNPWDLDVLFEGRLVNSLNLPADYLAVYFTVKTPEMILALLAVAAPLAFIAWRRNRTSRSWADVAGHFVLGYAAVFPFVFFVVFRPVSYDGMRHFLFVLPPVAAVAGLALDRLFAVVAEHGRIARGAFATIIGCYLLWHGGVMADLHPNQYVYYNQLVGGVRGAEHRFELDYWGNSYHEAVDRMVAYVKEEEARTGQTRNYRVMVCSSGTSAAYYFPPNFSLARNPREGDFYIASTRLGCDKEFEGTPIVTVTRDEATLSVVKDRRALRQIAPERLEAKSHQPEAPRQHPGLDLDENALPE